MASTPTTVSRLKLVVTRREGRYGAGTARLRVRSCRRAEKADTGRAQQVYPFARADAPRRPIRDGQSAFMRSLGPTRREGRYGTGKARLRVSSGRRAEKADTGRAKQVYPFARADALRGPIRDGQSAFTRSLVPTRRKGRYGTGKAGLSVCSG